MIMISKSIKHIRIIPKGLTYPIINITPIRYNTTKILKPLGIILICFILFDIIIIINCIYIYMCGYRLLSK